MRARAELDLRVGGRFSYRMEARDGSMGFDFCGRIMALEAMRRIDYEFDDGRRVEVGFDQQASTVTVWQLFDADSSHPEDQQRAGWQAILDNFKAYVESQAT